MFPVSHLVKRKTLANKQMDMQTLEQELRSRHKIMLKAKEAMHLLPKLSVINDSNSQPSKPSFEGASVKFNQDLRPLKN